MFIIILHEVFYIVPAKLHHLKHKTISVSVEKYVNLNNTYSKN